MSGPRFAFFAGCMTREQAPGYESSARAVLACLGVELVDLPFACCGRPVRGIDRFAFVYAGVRNLALAEQAGLTVLTACKCCFGNLRHAARFFEEDGATRARVIATLAKEGLCFEGKTGCVHLLTVLRHTVGIEAIVRKVASPRSGVKVAASYGCHGLRPSSVTRLDNPMAPTIFEELLMATGAEPVDFAARLECCGSPTANEVLSERMALRKLSSAAQAGAQIICTACPHCQEQLSSAQQKVGVSTKVLPYTVLLAEAFGIGPV